MARRLQERGTEQGHNHDDSFSCHFLRTGSSGSSSGETPALEPDDQANPPSLNPREARENMQSYVHMLSLRDFVLLCGIVREERIRRESIRLCGRVGLLDILEYAAGEAFGAIDRIAGSKSVVALMLTCTQAKKTMEGALAGGSVRVALQIRSSASIAQLQAVDLTRWGPGTVELQVQDPVQFTPLLQSMQSAVEEHQWSGPAALAVTDCRQESMHNLVPILPRLVSLERLELAQNDINDSCAMDLLACVAHLSRLKELDLGENDIGPEGAAVLAHSILGGSAADAAPLRSLVKLDMRVNDIRGGVRSLARSIEVLPNLQELNLFNNSIDDADSVSLLSALASSSQLTTLNLGFNNISNKGALQLADSIISGGLRKLHTLCLGANDIGDRGIVAIAQVLPKLCDLVRLMLDGNNISAEGMYVLTGPLVTLTALAELHLERNRLGDVGAEHVAEVLKAGRMICYVDEFSQYHRGYADRVVVVDS